MKRELSPILLAFLLMAFADASFGQAPTLGTASSFALFTANGALDNVGASIVTGDIGTNAGAFTGFPPGTVTGQIRLAGSAQANQAATDVIAAYASLTPVLCGTLISPTLGNGQVFTPGVYCQNTVAASSLVGTLTLNGPGLYIIKLNSPFSTASGSTIALINGACPDNVYFQVNGAVDIGVGSVFKGTILANGAIRLLAGASLEGRGLSVAGAISVNTNMVSNIPTSCSSASLGGVVYADNNTDGVRDGSDTPIEGVVVSLLNGANSPIASATTNAMGGYSFTGLTSGTPYSVSATTPTGYSATTPGITGPVTLTSGENNAAVDVGYSLLSPALTLAVLVDRSVAQPGDILAYTVVITNSGSSPATNVVVSNATTPGLTYVANSATVPAGTTFTPGTPMSSWTIAAIGAGQSVSLTFRAIANSSGILYNTASIADQTEQVCTSIPVKMCASDEFVLTVPAGRSRYSWYKDGVLIAGQISNTLTVSEPGSYSLGVDTIDGQCPAFSCCPFIVELDPVPVYQAVAIAATCLGNRPQNNGQLVLTNFSPTHTYQYSLGATFNPSASLSGAPSAIPANGILATTLPNPTIAQTYTVRVRNTSGCFTDVTVTLAPTVCECPAEICIPVVIQKTKLLPVGQRTIPQKKD